MNITMRIPVRIPMNDIVMSCGLIQGTDSDVRCRYPWYRSVPFMMETAREVLSVWFTLLYR